MILCSVVSRFNIYTILINRRTIKLSSQFNSAKTCEFVNFLSFRHQNCMTQSSSGRSVRLKPINYVRSKLLRDVKYFFKNHIKSECLLALFSAPFSSVSVVPLVLCEGAFQAGIISQFHQPHVYNLSRHSTN